ncbi:hypothetical protein F2Q68_00027063 [Brassica cretica]|uniref:Uncharacterized protein n=1 Tax=Brassica cretica TaxID=69181 RepID=A0A8S9IH49_BRACR|nr:hypothetical protein F2Q68_00027063 [Brassica cretica]
MFSRVFLSTAISGIFSYGPQIIPITMRLVNFDGKRLRRPCSAISPKAAPPISIEKIRFLLYCLDSVYFHEFQYFLLIVCCENVDDGDCHVWKWWDVAVMEEMRAMGTQVGQLAEKYNGSSNEPSE